MAYYNVSVDVSDLFDDMLVQAQKSFLIDKFCSLATVGLGLIFGSVGAGMLSFGIASAWAIFVIVGTGYDR